LEVRSSSKQITTADGLSRLPIDGNTETDDLESYLIMAETNDNPEELKLFDEQQQDPVLKEISYILKNCNRYKNHKYLAVYELKDGIVYRKP
jgi:hypothetical protein